MENKTLDLTLISAKGLTNARNVYAVASISDTLNKVQKFKTPINKEGGSNPTWDFHMQFNVNAFEPASHHSTLVVKIKAARMFIDKKLGEVRVPIKELLEGLKSEGKTMRIVSYNVGGRDGEPEGVLSFSYRFGSSFAYPDKRCVTVREVQRESSCCIFIDCGDCGRGGGCGDDCCGDDCCGDCCGDDCCGDCDNGDY